MALYNSGLTAYNHNLDTSREFYPKVRLIHQDWIEMTFD